jgi:hypothetical protein
MLVQKDASPLLASVQAYALHARASWSGCTRSAARSMRRVVLERKQGPVCLSVGAGQAKTCVLPDRDAGDQHKLAASDMTKQEENMPGRGGI